MSDPPARARASRPHIPTSVRAALDDAALEAVGLLLRGMRADVESAKAARLVERARLTAAGEVLRAWARVQAPAVPQLPARADTEARITELLGHPEVIAWLESHRPTR